MVVHMLRHLGHLLQHVGVLLLIDLFVGLGFDPLMYGSNLLHLLTCSTSIGFPLINNHPLEGCLHTHLGHFLWYIFGGAS